MTQAMLKTHHPGVVDEPSYLFASPGMWLSRNILQLPMYCHYQSKHLDDDACLLFKTINKFPKLL